MSKHGCGCQDDLKKEIKQIEKAAKKPTKTEHDKKKAELSGAFGKDKKK